MNRTLFISGLLCLSLILPAHAADEAVMVDAGHRSRPDFSGTWLLDKASSDDPEAKMKEARDMLRASRGVRGGMGDGPGRGQGSGMGDGHRGGGSGSPGGMLTSPIGDMRALVRGAEVLELSHDDPLLLISADDQPQQRLFTDYRGATVSAHGALQQRVTTAGWETDELVVETTRDGTPRLVQRYRLNADSGSLEVSTEITPPGASAPVSIKRVYVRADAQAATVPDAAP